MVPSSRCGWGLCDPWHGAPYGEFEPLRLVCHPGTECGAKLQTKRSHQRYPLLMETVEPVFGQIKEGRGSRQFLLRSLEKVSGEWYLIGTGQNLLKLFRFVQKPMALAGQPELFRIGLALANPGAAKGISYRHAGSHYRKFLILKGNDS